MYDVECPYCGSINLVEMENDDNFEHQCEDCEKVFKVVVEYCLYGEEL